MKYRIVVLGGYGHFGARITRGLLSNLNIQVIVTGRDIIRAKKVFDSEIKNKADLEFSTLDITADNFREKILSLNARLLIHTAGPFQAQDYFVARTCIEEGIDYIDLADGRDFVCNFSDQLDALAKKHQRIAITGASTLPALSSAVVDAFIGRFDALDEIQTVIAPAQRTPLGPATLQSVLSYCGRPFKWWQKGQWKSVVGWQTMQRVSFARLNWRLAAPCDVPDHALFVERYPGVQTVQFRAALELSVLQRALSLFSFIRSAGIALPLASASRLLIRLARLMDRFGSDAGGMFVILRGQKNEHYYELRWDLTAPALHGPEIPCMAAVLLARKLANSNRMSAGSYACMGLLTLEDFFPEFLRWGITHEVSESIQNFIEVVGATQKQSL